MPDAPAPTSPQAQNYSLKFEPIGEFTETELFVRNRVSGKVWITETVPITFKSMTGREVDLVNEAVKITDGMTAMHYKTEITYRNLAHSIVKIGTEDFSGTFEERLEKIKDKSATVLLKMSIAYLEFTDHVADLFSGKEVIDSAKKS